MTTAELSKTQDAQPAGTYTPTAVDEQKAAAAFRLISADPYIIRWQDGRTERVTARRLTQLQNTHIWATDF